jgi:hypothetical protein
MTGGWGKSYAALLIGAAALGTVYNTADAQSTSSTQINAPQSAPTRNVFGQGSATQQSAANAIRSTTGVPLSVGQFGAAQLASTQLPGQVPGLVVNANLRFSIDADDNGQLLNTKPGTDYRARATLGFNILSARANSNLDLSFGADLQYEDLAGTTLRREEDGLQNPYVNFGYVLTGVDSRFDAALSYRTDDIIDSIFVDTDGDLIDDTLLTSTGRVETLRYGLNYSFGLTAPFGMDFALGRREVNYKDSLDPNLFDRATDNAGVVARFRFNPVLTTRLIANASRYDAEDSTRTERDTTNFGAGLSYEIREDLRFDGDFTRTDIEEQRTVLGNRVTVDNDGLSARLALVKDMDNGTVALAARRTQYTITARDEIVVNRSMSLASGALGFSVGVSGSNTGDTVFIGSLNYTNQLANGVFSADISRDATVNFDNDEVARTRFGVGYTHILTPVSSVNARLNVADVENIGRTGITTRVRDSTRADVSVGYSHQLTRDWDWTVAYRYRYRRDAAGSSQNSNAIFAGIGRSFSIRPR